MYLDRGIVSTYRRSDGLSTIPDNQNILIHQSADTNNAPRDPPHCPVTWNPARTRPYSTLRLRLRPHIYPPLSQSPQSLHRCDKKPLIVASGIRC